MCVKESILLAWSQIEFSLKWVLKRVYSELKGK